MKKNYIKNLMAASFVAAMFAACGGDSESSVNSQTNGEIPGGDPSITIPDDPGANPSIPGSSADSGTPGTNPVIPSSSADSGIPGTEPIIPASSAAPSVGPGEDPIVPNSSATPGVDPGQDPVTPASSEANVPESSSSEVVKPSLEGGFPSIESYGPPSPEYTKDISATAKRGWNTRYWDACKPHCSWISDGSQGRTDTTTNESYVAGLTTARNCNIHDVEVPTFTLGNVTKYWFGYEGTNSACTEAKAGGVFTCTDMAPIAVNDTLSYGYVAGTADGKCGKCYHLQYDGSFKDESANNKPKETHLALKGKHMVVMASNIGMDVAGGEGNLPAGQFDLMVPGGGVGAYDALSIQVNGANVNWGAGFGGFLTECQGKLGYDKGLTDYQSCVKEMCDAAFGNAGFPNLLRGCHWFADWYMAADNPTYYIEEVECPQYLLDHYLTRINTSRDNNYKKVTDWSTYKEGDVLDTLNCWKAGEGPADANGWSNPNAGCEVE
ncbi:MAG: glycosyl hydrolase family 5 [Fibrobacter sp.]|nr:glycosyl hydrolase family 5 [Fibrobacter sp.]